MKTLTPMDVHSLFNRALTYIINILIIYIILILVLGLGNILLPIKNLLTGGEVNLDLSHAITDILSFLVMIELFRGFIEYFKTQRIRLHTMIDPAIIFIVRELIIKLYTHDPLLNTTLIGFSILLLCMGIIRSLAIVFSPKKNGY
ncbi:MAG: phosphate-starvation-inducible PsiE family protein [Desulfobacteraceae bacterium]|nr:phosphate-starvation-inducible PsiE family protein [Desulfobacteraceae bacterium]